METLISIFREVRDPRDFNAQHDLVAMLFIALAATLCGAKSSVDIADFAAAHEAELAEIVDLRHGPPSHDSFSRVFRLLDPEEMARTFACFVKALRAGLGLDPAKGVGAVDGKRLPPPATTPLAGPSPRPARSALTKQAKVRAISSGSSRRNTRLKLSWLGGPWRRSTISASSASWAAAKSAISTEDFAPHKVAASAMNSIAARSCCALKSRGSRTSRKIEMSVSIEALPNQESLLQNQLFLLAQ